MNPISLTATSKEYRQDCIVENSAQPNSCSGIIYDGCGNPLKNACIKAITPDYEPIEHTMSDHNGKFTLILPDVAIGYLVFSKLGFKTEQFSDFSNEMEVILKKQQIHCVVDGKVVFDQFAVSHVVKLTIANAHLTKYVFSKPDGSFVFTDIPSGMYTLTVQGSTCVEKTIYVTIPTNHTIYHVGTIHLQAVDIGCTVHGIISDTCGNPLEDVVVILYQAGTNIPLMHTLTNAEGLYFFGNLNVGNYYVEAYV